MKPTRRKRKQTGKAGATHRRGDLQDRIIKAVGHTRVEGSSRKALVNDFKEEERPAVARLIGRLIQRDILQDRVVLNGPAVGLTGRGMVGVVLDLLDLRKVNSKRSDGRSRVCPKCDHMIEKRSKQLPIRQEDIVEGILRATRMFTEKSDDMFLVLLDVKIVHGAPFNLLLTLLYRHEDDLMKYVRDIVQNIKFVRDTQTMLVPYSRAYPGHIHGNPDLWPDVYTPQVSAPASGG